MTKWIRCLLLVWVSVACSSLSLAEALSSEGSDNLNGLKLGAKGFLNYEGDIVILRNSVALEVHELAPVEKKYWVLLASSRPIPRNFGKDPSDLRKSANEVQDSIYLELHAESRELLYYQVRHSKMTEPITGQALPAPAFEMKYLTQNRDFFGQFNLREFVGLNSSRFLFKLNVRGPSSLVQVNQVMSPPRLPASEEVKTSD